LKEGFDDWEDNLEVDWLSSSSDEDELEEETCDEFLSFI